MAVKFFGQFLLEKGVISREELLKAIALQESVNVRFGEMARSMGFIADAEVDRVHQAQRSEDLRFGDMAVKMGILTGEQLQEVLAEQKKRHLYIGEALVNVGAFKVNDLQEYLDAFKADQAPYIIDKVIIPEGVPDPDLWEIAADLTHKMFTRIVNLNFKPGQCEMVERIAGNDTVIAIDLTGHVRARYLLSVSCGVRDLIAQAILGEEDVAKESDEVLVDTVMEFANIVCGNIAARAAQQGKVIEITPPEIIDVSGGGIDVPEGRKGLLFPLYVADERVEIGIFMEST